MHRSGWLDDDIFTFFATFLNFTQEYDVLGGFNTSLPTVVFSNTQETIKRVDPFYRDKIFNLLIKKPVQDQDEGNDDINDEMVKWYETSTNSNLDRILTAFEQQRTVMSDIIVPLHNNSHFEMLHVILPSEEKHSGVFVYDYLPKEADESNLISKIW